MRTQGKLCVTLGALAWLAGCTPDPSYDPVADAGDDIVVSLGTEGVLDGTASFDHDGSVATYEWTVLGAPE